MKRLLSWILVFVLCFGLFGYASAENVDLRTVYDSIEATYNRAIDNQEKGEPEKEVINEFRKLIRIFEEIANPSIVDFEDARVYYAYALARVELSKESPDYTEVLNQLRKCDENMYMVAAYRQYAKGMASMQNKDYADAITNLQAVVLKEFTAKRLDAIEECARLYREETLTKGKNACSAGKHELARGIYGAYLQIFDDDLEIKNLLNECTNTHTEDIVQEPVVEIITAVSTIPRTLKLTWKGDGDKYTVTWSSDLVRGKDVKSKVVEDKSLTIEDLLPGTVYRVTVDYLGFTALVDRETRKADDYTSENSTESFWFGTSSMFRFNESRSSFLSSGLASYEFTGDSSCKYLKNRTVDLFDNPISESCILFVFTTFGVPEDIIEKPYQLLLHIDGVATLLDTGTFGDEKVCSSGNYIYVLIYDLFDQAIEDYSDLSGKTFRLDLLVDDKFVASADGILQ